MELPLPMDQVPSASPCNNCRYWLGYYWFGIPMLCELKHQGHDWSELPWCDYFEEKRDLPN